MGYCICSAEDSSGELDSIYIETDYRKHGLGETFARNGIEWMKEKRCAVIRVTVRRETNPYFLSTGGSALP